MDDVFIWLQWTVALMALVIGAHVLGSVGLLAILAACVAALIYSGMASRARTARHAAPREEGLLATDELFRDPASGQLVRVHVDPRTGRRIYRADGEAMGSNERSE